MTTKTDVLPETGDELRPDVVAEDCIHESKDLQEKPMNDAENVERVTEIVEADKVETVEAGVVEETKVPTKKTRKKKKEVEEATTSVETVEETPEIIKPEEKPKKKRATARPKSVMSIDDERSVETDEDKARNDLIDLIESMKVGKILTGTIQGVERPDLNTGGVAIVYHGEYKVLIPAEHAVEPPYDFRDQKPEDVFHYLLTKRLGAEVDYVVKGIDSEAGCAVASRLEAMKAKRKHYYFGTDRNGNNLLYEGVCAEVRVVSVIRTGVFADLFGWEIYIPLRELGYQRMIDASKYFQAGQRILVKILEIDRSDKNNIKVKASVKQAMENPYEKALKKYTVGNRYVGTVSLVDTNGVFVALDEGIDCLCSYPKRGRPPRGARVTVMILGVNHQANRIWGAITHTAMAK